MGVLVDEKPDMPQQCVLAAQKPNHLLRCITRQVANRLRKVVLPQYSGETPPGVLHLVLGSSAQERYGPVRGHPEEGHKDNPKAEIPLL